MDFNTISKKLQAHPIPVVATAVSLLCVGVLYWRSPVIAQLETQVSERQAEWDRMEKNRLRANNLGHQLERARGMEQAIERRLMQASEIAINYDYFFRFEEQAGVKILNIAQGGELTKSPGVHLGDFKEFVVIPFNLSIQGDFAQTLRFLRAIEDGDHFARIDSLTYRRDEKTAAGDVQIVTVIKLLVLGRKS